MPEGPTLRAAVAQSISRFDLTAFSNKTAVSLSGGNKRKLSVAIALMGLPPILFLDEPSTGMDPVAKRHMWSTLASIARDRAKCSIVLTSHSMEEVEALCSRVGVMVGGRLRCLGSIAHLRGVHGKGWTLEIKLNSCSAAVTEAAADEITSAAAAAATAAAFESSGGGSATAAPKQSTALTRAEFSRAAISMGKGERVKEISEMGSGWVLHALWTSSGAVASSASSAANPMSLLTSGGAGGILDWTSGGFMGSGSDGSGSVKGGVGGALHAVQGEYGGGGTAPIPVSEIARWWAEENAFSTLSSCVSQAFPGAVLVERQGFKTTWRIPLLEGLPVSELFARAEGLKGANDISSFTLAQTTLESIFNQFASQQEEETQGPSRGLIRDAVMPAPTL